MSYFFSLFSNFKTKVRKAFVWTSQAQYMPLLKHFYVFGTFINTQMTLKIPIPVYLCWHEKAVPSQLSSAPHVDLFSTFFSFTVIFLCSRFVTLTFDFNKLPPWRQRKTKLTKCAQNVLDWYLAYQSEPPVSQAHLEECFQLCCGGWRYILCKCSRLNVAVWTSASAKTTLHPQLQASNLPR